MTDRHIRPPRVALFGMSLLALLLLLPRCGRNEEERLRALAADLSPEMAHQLVSADDTTFASFCRAAGFRRLRDETLALMDAIPTESPEAYAAAASLLLPHACRIYDRIAAEHDLPHYRFLRDFWPRLSPEEGADLLGRYRGLIWELRDTSVSPEAKIARLRQHLSVFERCGFGDGIVAARHHLAILYRQTGDTAAMTRETRSAVERARRDSIDVATCNLLSALAAECFMEGQRDSAFSLLDESLAIAMAHRLPDEASKSIAIRSRVLRAEGRITSAAELLEQAREVCRAFHGGYLELNYVVEAMELYADLGFWEVVGRLLQEAKVLSREHASSASRARSGLGVRERAELMEARCLVRAGEHDRGTEIFREIERRRLARPDHPRVSLLLSLWATDLMDLGENRRALAVIREGYRHAIEAPLPADAAYFTLLEADASVALDSMRRAADALRRYDTQGDREEGSGDSPYFETSSRMLREALGARVLIDAGDLATAAERLRKGIDLMARHLRETEAGPQGYDQLRTCDVVRDAMHALAGADVEKSYSIEMVWQGLGCLLGASPSSGRTERCTASRLAELLDTGRGSVVAVSRFLDRLEEEDALHCHYRIAGNAILRWSAGGGAIRLDTLALTTDEARARVRRSLEGLSRDPGDPASPLSADLRRDLHELAAALLPPEIAGENTREWKRFLVSSDGFLELIPFEALNVAEEGYEPLLARCDIAELRFVGRAPLPPTGHDGIVISNPRIPAWMRRRYPSLTNLEHGAAEAGIVASAFPGSRLLDRENATKERLTSIWEGSSFLYVAAHFVRAPETPDLAFLPLASSKEDLRRDEAFLAIEEIRAADLRRCGLVVLSGCASGVPHIETKYGAPSLGDAFLDAGAGEVIQTRWRVRDDAALRMMRAFVALWRASPDHPAEALCRARRDLLSGPAGPIHPFYWAAYTIKRTDL